MIYPDSDENIKKATELLKSGEIVAIPTETVYGLAADAANETAVSKIFEIKGRPNFNPLISHYAQVSEIEKDVIFNERAKLIADEFWPGPISLILPKQENSRISKLVSAGLETAAIRMPNHPLCLKILEAFRGPIAAPSANPSSRISPSKAIHVKNLFQDKVKFILDGGDCNCGLESTILDLSTEQTKILRYGAINAIAISNALQGEIVLSPDDKEGIKAPGMLLKHYSPQTKLKIDFSLENIAADYENSALILYSFSSIPPEKLNYLHSKFKSVFELCSNANELEAAANLYSILHKLDDLSYEQICVEKIPKSQISKSIEDRLKRAAA